MQQTNRQYWRNKNETYTRNSSNHDHSDNQRCEKKENKNDDNDDEKIRRRKRKWSRADIVIVGKEVSQSGKQI